MAAMLAPARSRGRADVCPGRCCETAGVGQYGLLVPELPELEALAAGLTAATSGRMVVGAVVWQAATLKTAAPGLDSLVGERVVRIWRRGKFLGIDIGQLTLLVHLMQSGRLALAPTVAKRPGRAAALAIDLDGGQSLRLREAATEHRMNAHLFTQEGLAAYPPLRDLGPEPLGLSPAIWGEQLARPPARLHTAIREGRRVAGIGRAYANDIIWAARLSPFARTDRLDDDALGRLAKATDTILGQALLRARETITTDLPTREKRLTTVHGHAGEPCLRCGTSLARVSYVSYEIVYCPDCQTGGRRYADRRMSRLIR